MLKKVVLLLDPLKPESWTEHHVEDIRPFLMEQFGSKFPDSGRIYYQQISAETDVTPVDEAGIEWLGKLEGPFHVVVYPEGPFALPIAAFLFVAATFVALASAGIPSVPPAAQRQQTQSSPNNELSDRVNRARINGRVADIFGTVRSTPDLAAAPYRVFENNKEVEIAFMCVGRGEYSITDVRDGETLAINIPGTSVMFYGPYSSPNSSTANTPQLTIGQYIRVPVLNTKRNNSVNGQVLRPPNAASFTGSSNVRFRYPNVIELFPGTTDDFTKLFVEGDSIVVTNATMTGGVAVTEHVKVLAHKASATDPVYIVVLGKTGQSISYDCDGGIMFPSDQAGFAAAFFTPGSTVQLTQTAGPAGIDLSGTYTIASATQFNPTFISGNDATPYGAPAKFIVKFTNPAAVNSDWSSLNGAQFVNFLEEFEFDVQHPSGVSYNLDLNNTYTIVSVTKETIVLDNPGAVDADWATIHSNGDVTPYLSPTLAATGQKWVGPFILTDEEMHSVYNNFVAINGLYKDDGTTQTAETVGIEVEVTPVDASDTPTGSAEIFQTQLQGSNNLKEQVAITLKSKFSSFFGRCKIRARRTTNHDDSFVGTVIDEVRWRDTYSVSTVDLQDFGNVTTVQTIIFATASALAVKERKLNALVTRKLPARVGSSGNIFTDSPLTATQNAADILVAICRDKYIGNRTIDQIDVDNIYTTVNAVGTYFGHAHCKQFNYTFDNDNMSFEETVNAVAQAVFCVAYRRGNVIRLSFEKETNDSVLLFNHRNIVPGSQKRSISFGYAEDNDGVEFIYVDPKDDAVINVFLPEATAVVNPKRVESVGIRTHLQAYFHAWRIWNKIRYQNVQCEFDALQEAELLLRNDRILVADLTRPKTQDGEILSQASLELTLSQNIDFTGYASFTIFVQHTDGTTESKGITAGSAANKVVLAGALAHALALDPEGTVRASYLIIGNTEKQQTAFLVQEREPSRGLVSVVRAVNYDARYYEKDDDYIDNDIDENGYGTGGGYTPGIGGGYQSGGVPVGGVVNFTCANIGSGSGGSNGGSVHGVSTFEWASLTTGTGTYGIAGTVNSGSISGETNLMIASRPGSGTYLIVRLRVLTSTLRPSPATAYFTTVSVSSKAVGPFTHAMRDHFATAVDGAYTILEWGWEELSGVSTFAPPGTVLTATFT
mgnify:CR=1 FL=1